MRSATKPPRAGEKALPFDPAETAGDATLTFIGKALTPWKDLDSCPKNMIQAQAAGQPAQIQIDPAFRPGLSDLAPPCPVWVLTWMHAAPRNLIIQAPRHRPEPVGVFALRSPSRPNPIGLSRTRMLALDIASGRLYLDALDCLDGTPIIDIKPVMEAADLSGHK